MKKVSLSVTLTVSQTRYLVRNRRWLEIVAEQSSIFKKFAAGLLRLKLIRLFDWPIIGYYTIYRDWEEGVIEVGGGGGKIKNPEFFALK